MIEAKELRIENYYEYDKEVFRVGTLKDDYAHPIVKGCNNALSIRSLHFYSQMKPIQLTEEWLVKFGFVKRFDSFLLRHKNGVISTYLSDNSVGLYDSEHSYNVGFGLNMGELRVKHIHQLQNLYFALTNEELKITE